MGRVILSAVIAGLISMGGVVLATATQPGGMTGTAWLIAGVTGVITAGKDIQSFLAHPPA